MDNENIWVGKIKELMEEYDVPMDSEFDYFFDTHQDNDVPASAGEHHSNMRWGLFCHIYYMMRVALRRSKTKGYSARSVVKVCLVHDLDKLYNPLEATIIGITKKLPKGKVSNKTPLYHPKPVIKIPHSINSLYRAMEFFTIDELECQAIIMHMGRYSYALKPEAMEMTEFSMLIHLSDMEASQLLETTHKKDKDTGAYLPDSPPMLYAELLRERAEKGE